MVFSKRLKHRWKLITKYYLTHKTAFDPLFVISAGRDGSNLLVDYLNQLEGVAIGNEVLNPALAIGFSRNIKSKKKALKHILYSLNSYAGKIRGVKIHFAQLESRGITFNDFQKMFPTAKYLVLYRRSIADQYVSQERAVQSNQWLLRENDQRAETAVKIDQDKFVSYCDRIKNNYLQLMELDWIKKRGIISSYEELAGRAQELFDQTFCPFLGVPSVRLTTKLVKQNTKPLSETVENYEEVCELLTGDTAHHEYHF